MSRTTQRPSGDDTPTHLAGAAANLGHSPFHPVVARTTPSSALASGPVMTRRAALRALLGLTAGAAVFASPLRALAAEASKETTDELNAAQAAYDDAQAKLDAISDEYASLSEQLNQTVAQIEQVQAQIDTKQAEIKAKQNEIDKKQAELSAKQQQLSDRIAASYKGGSSSLLDVILNSSSFEDLSSNLAYLGKINQSDEELINEVKDAKAALEQDKAGLEAAKAELEKQKANLETLKEQQTEQLAAVQAKQDEATQLVNGLSQDVKDLVAKRDAEILAAAEEERRQAEAAAAAKSAGASGVSGSLSGASASAKGAAIVSATTRVGSPGAGLCAMWVSRVYSAAGLGYPGGNANNMYWNYCTSSNKGDLQPGMIVAVSTHSHSSAGRAYGHVGIYIGNGMVRHNVGPIATDTLDYWISYFGTTVTPRWGWAG
ncbi:hypothetical protein [uncultured Parolsenella sp.]|uniref:coiled-coil domain-containing protein n=1 Tax=uncultured Parolsenella sp. TaxID=2083008 RepID=UPI0027D96D5D|nr:hypothetical protein [uncultured Parolsenella sp.]